ncbi:MAG: DUF2283 domain-containing protein [Anaerolineae bacterium]
MAATIDLDQLLTIVPRLLAVSRHVWIDYDEEADVLYVSFRKPQQATDSELEDNVVWHYRDHELVGVTIINAQQKWGVGLAT